MAPLQEADARQVTRSNAFNPPIKADIAFHHETSSGGAQIPSKLDVCGQAGYLLIVLGVNIGKDSVFSLTKDMHQLIVVHYDPGVRLLPVEFPLANPHLW